LALLPAAQPLLALAVIRLASQVAFKNASVVRALERSFFLAGLGAAGDVAAHAGHPTSSTASWEDRRSELSVRALPEGALTAGVVLLIALGSRRHSMAAARGQRQRAVLRKQQCHAPR
jgi:hypothetical protein